jgi:hypothetical protein
MYSIFWLGKILNVKPYGDNKAKHIIYISVSIVFTYYSMILTEFTPIEIHDKIGNVYICSIISLVACSLAAIALSVSLKTYPYCKRAQLRRKRRIKAKLKVAKKNAIALADKVK